LASKSAGGVSPQPGSGSGAAPLLLLAPSSLPVPGSEPLAPVVLAAEVPGLSASPLLPALASVVSPMLVTTPSPLLPGDPPEVAAVDGVDAVAGASSLHALARERAAIQERAIRARIREV